MKRYFLLLSILLLAGVVWYSWGLSAGKKPNVIVLLLDTTRADHLGLYGYERDTSPNLDKFGRDYVKFNYAVPSAPWTPPSVASILTGMYVGSHGLMPPNSRDEARSATSALNQKVVTLAEILQENGYQTAGVTPNPWVTSEFGFDQGFQNMQVLLRSPAGGISTAGLKLAKDLKENGKPFFLYLHYLDPHETYNPPDKFDRFHQPLTKQNYSPEMTTKINLYDGEILYMDAAIGKLFDGLKETGVFDNSIVVIVGDHGEQFMEHGFISHGNQLYNTETHVPLLLKLGSDSPRNIEVDHTVSTVDIYATILSYLNIELPTQAALSVPLLDEERQAARAGVFTEIRRLQSQKAFVSYDGRKLIIGSDSPEVKVDPSDPTKNIVGAFNSRADYSELAKLSNATDLEELQGEFRRLSQAILALHFESSGENGKVTDDTLKQLESLGYLNH